MKKIKGLLILGLFALFGIGSSFGNELDQINHLSVFNKLGFGLVNLSCGGKYCSAPGLIDGTISPSGSASRSTYMIFLIQFNKGGGFELSGYSSNYGRYTRLMTVPPLISIPVIDDPLGPTQDVDPGSGEDIPPLIFDSSLNYFTFSYANQLMYNGQSFYNLSVGDYQLEYCFYGLNYSLSCVYKNLENSLDYKFFHFNLNLNTLQFEEHSGFIIDPVSGTNYSFVYSFDSQNRIMYNIYNGQSDTVSDFTSFSVIDKGYIDVTSLTFLNRTFVSDLDLGYFGDIVYNSGNFYFQGNSVLFVATGDNDFLESSPALVLYQDSSVPNILGGNGGNGGNGNQSTGSMVINSGLISMCLTSPSFYDLNTIFCNRVFGGRDLSYIQGQIGSGAYLQSYIDGSGNLVYVIDIVDEPGTLTGSVVWECYGDRCINSQSGSWGDVEPWEILHLSGGDILSSGYYLGFFESINETGYFFKCPYSYNNSRWVAGRSILNAIGRDPFLPINCFIAAYENGRRIKLFDEAFNGYSWGPLMNGDTQNHHNLFTFFDVLLSVALIFFLMKFYHLFK